MVDISSIIHDLILQLVSVSIPSDTMHRDEHIRNLTPITNVSEGASAPNEPEGTFLVGKLKPLDDFPSLSKYIKRYDILEENRIKDTVYKDTGKYNFLYSPREIDDL